MDCECRERTYFTDQFHLWLYHTTTIYVNIACVILYSVILLFGAKITFRIYFKIVKRKKKKRRDN